MGVPLWVVLSANIFFAKLQKTPNKKKDIAPITHPYGRLEVRF